MSTATALTPPGTDTGAEDPETKFTLLRPAGATGILPSPGTRRFSRHFAHLAMGLDSTLDAIPAGDQSPFLDGFDVASDEDWKRWVS